MDRDRVLPLALALLAVVALALAAATLDSAVVADGAGLGGDGSGVGDDDGNVAGEPAGGPDAAADRSLVGAAGSSEPLCLPALREPPALLVGGLLFVGLFAVVYRSTRSTAAGTAVCGAVGLPVGLLWVGLAFCGSAGDIALPSTGGAVGEGLLPAGGRSDGAAGAVSSSTPLIALFVAVAVAVVLVALLATGSDERAAGETSDPDPDPGEGENEEPAAAVGRVAAAAADRIADGDADTENEVYRAWRRMTERLDVASPETTTPREFRRAAVEAGMDREDVAALTRLFESVRYGDREPTDDRERRAVETFRRLRPDDERG
ncbi:hypothetical protein BRC88_14010 [Halobacteriales archaeon QS_4_69_225]|nr:MAG: hypothetical protein BRC88_14010 [Halobacteriales archaeon QS_4_69_225]